MIVPPVYIPPGEKPPCDKENPDDKECEGEEEPPVPAPEPGLLLLLAVGGGIGWGASRRKNSADA